jgi:hypothetical protein
MPDNSKDVKNSVPGKGGVSEHFKHLANGKVTSNQVNKFQAGTVMDNYYNLEQQLEECTFHEALPVNLKKYPNGQTVFVEPSWDPSYTIGTFGSRGTGKSYCLRYLLAILAPYYPEVYVFTETTLNCYWEQMTNPKYIIQGFNKTAIMEIFKNQEKKVRAWREGKWEGNPQALMIWDDCVPEDMYWDPVFRWMFFNGRHYKLGIWMNSQYFFKIPPGYRGNFDWVLSMAQDQGRQIEAFFQEMAFAVGVCKRILLGSFNEMFKNATVDRGIILFHIRDKTRPIKDRIYTFTAEDPGIFWVGSQDYWRNNLPHLELIRKGIARERAEKEVKWEEQFGLVDPSKPEETKNNELVNTGAIEQRFRDPQDTYNYEQMTRFSATRGISYNVRRGAANNGAGVLTAE